ncbi:hypothetical protein JFU48_19610 [Pseudomonas sp. TH49]|uniref:HEAT repeat domain-containing protein n=1 Tax=Pseudomonas fluorescens R124 TaxID=743713 RepID=A0A7U9GTV4_PSEFL|nr:MULTISPECIES: hypothetical protein [Pseudomonas]EJZ58757.1 hypothetical protein I1A_003088 [Pseudomonas fluorescens R124]MBK5343583.1 hypothetical protein [Pseudomonas sp. TH49]
MDSKTYRLLNDIPEHADYAVEAGDLDPEDIPQERVDAVEKLLCRTQDDNERFLAAKLLTNWGYPSGLMALEKCLEKPESIEWTYSHRLHGYDDTYCHILFALTQYYANMADRGQAELARAEVFPLVSKIIVLASSQPFEITGALDFARRTGSQEYLPFIKDHLLSIVDHFDLHRWKIYDAIVFLLEFDADFVVSVLKQKNKIIEDFKPMHGA